MSTEPFGYQAHDVDFKRFMLWSFNLEIRLLFTAPDVLYLDSMWTVLAAVEVKFKKLQSSTARDKKTISNIHNDTALLQCVSMLCIRPVLSGQQRQRQWFILVPGHRFMNKQQNQLQSQGKSEAVFRMNRSWGVITSSVKWPVQYSGGSLDQSSSQDCFSSDIFSGSVVCQRTSEDSTQRIKKRRVHWRVYMFVFSHPLADPSILSSLLTFNDLWRTRLSGRVEGRT